MYVTCVSYIGQYSKGKDKCQDFGKSHVLVGITTYQEADVRDIEHSV